MQNTEFEYNSIEVVCGDLKVIFIVDEKTTVPGKTNIHMHSFWELFLLKEGSLSVTCGEKDHHYRIKNNQAIIIPPNTYHDTIFLEDTIKQSVLFTFEKAKIPVGKDLLYAKVNSAFSGAGVTVLENDGYLEMLLSLILEGCAKESLGKDWRIRANVTELVFHLYDMLKKDPDALPEDDLARNNYWVYKYKIDRLLDIYYMTDISLEQLSTKLFASPQTITRIISAAYGKSFNELKNELKMRNAKKMLRETKLSISEIGARIGYTTQRGFLAAFSKYEGCTPSEYRKRGS